MSNKNYSSAITVATIISLFFIILVFSTSKFNMVPDDIYVHLNLNGSGKPVFITFFNVAAGALLFFVVYKIMSKLG